MNRNQLLAALAAISVTVVVVTAATPTVDPVVVQAPDGGSQTVYMDRCYTPALCWRLDGGFDAYATQVSDCGAPEADGGSRWSGCNVVRGAIGTECVQVECVGGADGNPMRKN